MANRYWVGGSGNWSDDTNHWATSSGGAPGAGNLPTSTDDVFFDSASSAFGYTVTVTTGAVCDDITATAPGSGNLTLNMSAVLTISGSLSFYSGMLRNSANAFVFNATTTGKTIDFNNIGLNNAITFNGNGGGWTINSTFDCQENLSLLAGTLDTNGQTIGCLAFSSTGTSTRTLTLGASIIICTSWTLSGSGFTFNEGTSSIRVFLTGTFTGASETYYDVKLNGTSHTIVGSNSFTSLSRTGTATKTDSLILTAGTTQTVSGTFTLTGDSAINNILCETTTHGTSATISAGTVSVSNASFKDIVGTGAGSWNFAASAAIGDCGGNTGITATTAATQYLQIGASANWSTAGNWFLGTGGSGGAGRVPLPQDTARLDANSFTAGSIVLTQDMPRVGPVDFTGTTNSPTWSLSVPFSFFGSLTLVSGITLSGTSMLTYEGRSSSGLTSAGKSFDNSITIDGPAGTLTLQDALSVGSSRTLNITRGGFVHNNFAVSCGTYQSNSGATRTITWGTADLTITGNAGTVFNTSDSTGITFTVGTGNVIFTYSGSTGTRTINTSNALRIAPLQITAGTDTVSISRLYCRGLDLTGFAGTFAGSGEIDVTVGNVTFSTGMTRTWSDTLTLGAVTGTKVLTMNGKTMAATILFAATAGNTWQLADALSNTGNIRHVSGTLDTNNVSVTSNQLIHSSGTRVLLMSANTWTITGLGACLDFTPATGLTVTPGTSTFKMTNTSSTAKQFNGANKTFYNLWYAPGTGTGTLIINNSNTFNNFKDDGTASHTLAFVAGETTTFSTFTVSGSASHTITVTSSTAANHSLVKTGGGTIICNYLNISRSQASPAYTWYAGRNSTNSGNNSGWIFGDANSGNFFFAF